MNNLTKSNFWYVKQIHSKEAYNDSDTYAIVTGDDERIIAKDCTRDNFDKICRFHNFDLLDEPKIT